jgi:hypothetical protein
MTDDLVKHLRNAGRAFVDNEYNLHARAADRIEELQETIAKIQYTNLRRDMNIDNRTKEIERLCKGKQNEADL